MKILVISQYYYPEPFRTTNIVEGLVSLGHEVDLYCQIPTYPIGKWYEGYDRKHNRNEVRNGVNIRRSFAFKRTQNLLLRTFNYYSFPHFCKKDLKKNKKQYDVVFALQLSPIMGTNPAVYYAKKHNLKLVVYSQDMWPASILAGGIKKQGLIYKHFLRKSRKIYSKADSLLVSSEPHVKYIQDILKQEKEVIYLPQFTIENSIHRTPDIEHPHLIWIGNIGKVQDLDTIIKAAKILQNTDIIIDIVGDGLLFEYYKDAVNKAQINNIVFHGRLAEEALRPLIKTSVAALLSSTKDEVSQLTLPAKVQTYLIHGLPIIASAEGATNDLVLKYNCGLICPNGDFLALAENIKKIVSCGEEQLMVYSTNARNLYYSKMDKTSFYEVLLKELSK